LHCDQIDCMGLFIFSYISWSLLCALRCDLFLRKFHGILRRMYIVLMLDEIFCKHQFTLDLWHYRSGISLLIFCLDDLSFSEREVLKSHNPTVLDSVSVFRFLSVCLMKLFLLVLGAYSSIIVIFFWCISPLISINVFSSLHQGQFEVYFAWYMYCYFCLFSGAIVLVKTLF
jgi:hypothetical protein